MMNKNKLIVPITCGFGNQLFQYAFGYAMAKRTGQDLYIDTRAYEIDKTKKYELSVLNIIENFASAEVLKDKTIYKEPSFSYHEEVREHAINAYMAGYWQSEKYFSEYRDEILKMFEFKNLDFIVNDFILNDILNSNSVAIHVRTGDYILEERNVNVHFVCKKDYYKNALAKISEMVENPKFYVFTDDISLAANLLPFEYDLNIVNSTSWQEDFYFMTKAKHNIVCNSSFSWWAAWLNENPNKIVIAPNKWFTDQANIDYKDVVPESWIKVSVD